MGSFTGRALFSATLFFFFLGLIFTIVGYSSAWLEGRDGFKPGVESIRVRQVCFSSYHFPVSLGGFLPPVDGNNANDKKPLNGCFDTTRTSQFFREVNVKVIRPDWYQNVQEMHLTCIILMGLTFILAISFLIAYCLLRRQLHRRRRPSSALILSKAGLALWFILPLVIGVLQIVEPILFYIGYERDKETFFYLHSSNERQHQYGPGFFITIAAAVCLIVCSILGLIIFISVVRKMVRLSSGDAKAVFADEFANDGRDSTELERLSNDDVSQDEDSQTVIHRKAYPVPAPRKSQSRVEEEDRSYQNIPKQRNQTSGNNGGQSREHSRPEAIPRASKYYEASRIQENTTPSVVAESTYSTEAPSSVFTNIPYNQRLLYSEQPSDTDSTASSRNKAVVRGNAHDRQELSRNTEKPKVINPPKENPMKHSRYAAY